MSSTSAQSTQSIQPERILIVQTGFLGDVVLSTPVFDAVARKYPGAKLTVLTTPAAISLIKYHPAVSEIIAFDKRKTDSGVAGLLRMAKRLRALRFTKVFSLHKSWRTAALLYLARIPERYGFSEAAGGLLYTARAKRKDLKHEVLRNLAILRSVGVEPDAASARMHIELSAESEQKADAALQPLLAQDKPLVGVAPGSVWATKRWSPAGFADVAKHFLSKGYGVVILGGADDAASADAIEQSVGADILNLTGKLSLLESAAVVSRLQLLVTNDSAPLHLASARGIPVVAAFCATIPEFGFGPWNVPSEVVGVDGLPCRPCGSHGSQTCPTGTWACINQLPAAAVIAAGERLLQNSGSDTFRSGGVS